MALGAAGGLVLLEQPIELVGVDDSRLEGDRVVLLWLLGWMAGRLKGVFVILVWMLYS